MAGVLHGSARTTPRIRAELQASQETTRVLAARHGLNPKTVQKWRKRTTTADQPMGPRRPRRTVLTEAEEAIVVAFRRRPLLPLDENGLLGLGQNRAAGPSWPHRLIGGGGALAPLLDRLGVQPVTGGEDAGRLLRRLELGSNARRRAGAAV